MTKDIESPQWEGSGEQTSLWVLCPSKLPTRGQQEVFPFSAHHSPPTLCSAPCLPLSWSSPSIPPLTSFLLSSPLPSFAPSFPPSAADLELEGDLESQRCHGHGGGLAPLRFPSRGLISLHPVQLLG